MKETTLPLSASTHLGYHTTKSVFGYMRQKELMQIVPFSPATLWRLVKSRAFVQPVKISARITAWNRAEVHAWLESKGGA